MNRLAMIIGAASVVAAAPAAAKPGHAKDRGEAISASKPQKSKGRYAVDGKDSGRYYSYGRGACPPGLAKKNELCLPHGQFRKVHRVGQRFPGNYGSVWSYDQIPFELRNRYNFDPRDRYYYGDGYLYRVDPRTQLVREVVNAILR